MRTRNPWLRLATDHAVRTHGTLAVADGRSARLPTPRQGLAPDAIATVTRACAQTLRQFGDLPTHLLEHAPLFSPRDAPFLLTLCEEDEPHYLEEQVLCLAALSSRRGLPRNLLEVHLRNLSAERMTSHARGEFRLTELDRIAEELRIQREEVLPNEQRQVLLHEFSRHVPATGNSRVGWLVTAAVADEANGIRGAVAAVLDWVEKQEERTQAWQQAIEDLIQGAFRADQTAHVP